MKCTQVYEQPNSLMFELNTLSLKDAWDFALKVFPTLKFDPDDSKFFNELRYASNDRKIIAYGFKNTIYVREYRDDMHDAPYHLTSFEAVGTE